MNNTTETMTNQGVQENLEKKSRAAYRRNAKKTAKEEKHQSHQKTPVKVPRTQEQDDLVKKADEILESLKSKTWRDLETKGKFSKDDKLSFIDDDMLIVGCDIGSEKHYMRAIDTRGRELSSKAFSFENNLEGFTSAKDWMIAIAAANSKEQIVMGLEPTGHYWFDLAIWMISEGISVVQVNPYAVKQSKEIEDNSQRKDDTKDPKLIANLVKDGNFGMPYLPEGVYADLRRLSMFRDQLTEDRTRTINRLHREMKIYFPEYKEAFGKLDGGFALSILKVAPFPKDLAKLGEDGIREIWKENKLRGRGYSRAKSIVEIAETSVGMTDGSDSGKKAVAWFAEQLMKLDGELAAVREELRRKAMEVPYAENVLEICGIGSDTLSGILAEMGDISRFDDVKEIQKLSGLGLVACSSGKHNGETKISHRGRKRLRTWLFHAAKSVVVHDPDFKELHKYYTTRPENPLKKMQSLIAIACKLLRIIYTMLKTGVRYDGQKMRADIVRSSKEKNAAA